MIRILDKNVADKISAGEVVERPVSIIKELLENSIDAKSSKITVEIKDGGKSYIRVTDNGIGIKKAEVNLAFFRHATSKIVSEDDLETIDTLGFRGEALASIASVSKVEFITKSEDENFASRSVLWGGEVLESSTFGAPQGTSIIVRDIFYNTPARLKFLKSNKTEAGAIIEMVSQIAIAYPNIKFMLINNDKILFSTNGRGRLIDVVSTITSSVEARSLINIDYENEAVKVFGLTSSPEFTKASRKGQTFFVNGRVVNSKIIQKGLYEAYKDRIFESRHPISYIFVNVKPQELDVNIHPNKKEVKFEHEDIIIKAVKDAIVYALNSQAAVTSLKESSIKLEENIKPISKENNKNILPRAEAKLENYSESISIKEYVEDKVEDKSISVASFDVDIIKDYENTKLENDIFSEKTKQIQEEIFSENEYKSKLLFDFSKLEILGQIFGTYIQLNDSENIYLIDQHAAHERVFFEKFLKAYESANIEKQVIFSPYIIDVSHNQKELENIWMEIIDRCGYYLEEFGPRQYKVLQIPMVFSIGESEEFLKDFFDTFGEAEALLDKNITDKIATKACKAAIKGNSAMSKEEIESLLNQMQECDNPYSCPHGRPTFVKIAKKEVEKRFKRI